MVYVVGLCGQQVVVRSKPYSHPIIIAVLREAFFANIREGSPASKYHNQFKSSLPDSRPTELEIPSAMLALVATSVCIFFSCHLHGHDLLFLDRSTQPLMTTAPESAGRQTSMPIYMKTYTLAT